MGGAHAGVCCAAGGGGLFDLRAVHAGRAMRGGQARILEGPLHADSCFTLVVISSGGRLGSLAAVLGQQDILYVFAGSKQSTSLAGCIAVCPGVTE